MALIDELTTEKQIEVYPKEKEDRNQELVKDTIRGMSVRDRMDKYGITASRIYQILSKYKIKK